MLYVRNVKTAAPGFGYSMNITVADKLLLNKDAKFKKNYDYEK